MSGHLFPLYTRRRENGLFVLRGAPATPLARLGPVELNSVSQTLRFDWAQWLYGRKTRVPANERTMTDVIERAGGLDSQDPQWVDPMRPGSLLDRSI